MPISLPAEIVTGKNALYSSEAFHELLEIQSSYTGQTYRFVNNNEDVKWKYHWWTKFRFESGDDQETADGDLHEVSVKVSNVTGTMQGYLEDDPNGMIGDTVIYRYVKPTVETPAIEEWFSIVDATATPEWVIFTLGAENWFMNRFPANVYRRNVCRYRPYMTDVCPYTNSSSCDRHFSTCISLGRAQVFGGQPGIPGGSFDV